MDGRSVATSSGPVRSRKYNGRRGWSTKEEEVLAECMKRIIREGWKSENGFKTGFQALLEKYMKEKLPNTTLKAEPHINSRITVWKRNYNSLFEILKTTGVGMDSTTHMVEATEEQWENFLRKDSNVRGMWSKSWPLYLAWCEIFGGARATGEQSEDFVNAAAIPSTEPIPEAEVREEHQGESQTPTGDPQYGESSGLGKTSSGRKRKSRVTDDDPFIRVMQDFVDTACARLGDNAYCEIQEANLNRQIATLKDNVDALEDEIDDFESMLFTNLDV